MPIRMPSEIRQRLDRLAQQTSEWQSWLQVLAETLRAAQHPAWNRAAQECDRERPAATALLDGVTLTVDPRLARDWIRRLLEVAAASGSRDAWALTVAARANRLDALAFLEAAVCQDDPRLTELSRSVGADPQALGALGHLAALPLLQACGRHLAGHVTPTWPHGYCPICGAWPALAEIRGLQRARRLRCARCGGDW